MFFFKDVYEPSFLNKLCSYYLTFMQIIMIYIHTENDELFHCSIKTSSFFLGGGSFHSSKYLKKYHFEFNKLVNLSFTQSILCINYLHRAYQILHFKLMTPKICYQIIYFFKYHSLKREITLEDPRLT